MARSKPTEWPITTRLPTAATNDGMTEAAPGAPVTAASSSPCTAVDSGGIGTPGSTSEAKRGGIAICSPSIATAAISISRALAGSRPVVSQSIATA